MPRVLKIFLSLLTLGLVSACRAPASDMPVRAVYLVQGEGQLSAHDLARHPEILVTNSLDEFEQAAHHRIGLWIDKNSTRLVLESNWLDQAPQAFYPIIMVGYNDTLLSFRDSLALCCFSGPANPDYSGAEPGFSVYERKGPDLYSASVVMLEGFKQVPTVDAILKISNDLLDGKIVPTPTKLPLLNIASPTPPTSFVPTLTQIPTP